eukprot:1678575-Pyramimonas_sp.AAC.1
MGGRGGPARTNGRTRRTNNRTGCGGETWRSWSDCDCDCEDPLRQGRKRGGTVVRVRAMVSPPRIARCRWRNCYWARAATQGSDRVAQGSGKSTAASGGSDDMAESVRNVRLLYFSRYP